MPSPSSARSHADDRGFTLLEVLVALAIAVPALLLLCRQGAFTLGLTDTSAAYAEAVSRAQSRLESILDTALRPGERNGDDGGRYRWRTQVTVLSTIPPHASPPRSAYAAGTTLYAVHVEISWPGPDRPRLFALDTRRLGPAVAQAP